MSSTGVCFDPNAELCRRRAGDLHALLFADLLCESVRDSMRDPTLRCGALKNHVATRRVFELICCESAAKEQDAGKSSNISIKCYSQAPTAGEFFFTLNE